MDATKERRRFSLGLDGSVALVTGAARGIGLETVSALLNEGVDVVLTDVSESSLDGARLALGSKPKQPVYIIIDVTDEDSVASGFREARKRLGRVDLLVNNAGYAEHLRPEDTSYSTWRRVIDACLTGTFLCSREFARNFESADSRGGAIVNLSSISASSALGRGIFAYSAAKAGIEALSREFALEWAHLGIRVNSVAPCQVRTEGFEAVASEMTARGDAFMDRILRGIPSGRIAEPSEVVDGIMYLLSSRASMVSGSVLYVDGANHAMNAGATVSR